MIALVDCNACYASCEQIFRPDLRGKPIVVLSNNDGCIVTRNKEAKALGIPNLQPYFKIKGLLAQHKVNVFSSNYELYGDISTRIMATLSTFTPELEIYSIDEAFLEVTGVAGLASFGMAVKKACWQQHRMPVCVGIAPTKTLAKLANHIAKKSNRLDGVCVIKKIEPWQAVFSKIKVAEVWGVGSRTAKRLALQGIHSVAQLQAQPPRLMRKTFGVTLERTVRELNGELCIAMEQQPPPKKEIFCSRSFSQKITTQAALKESVVNYAVRTAEKLRRQHSLTQRVYVTLQTSRFEQYPYSNSHSIPLRHSTNDTRDIIQAAASLCDQLYRDNYRYARAGVGLLELSEDTHSHRDLFEQQQSEKSKTAMQVTDSINQRFGKSTLFFAGQGIQRSWAMARKLKSPAYTTNLRQLPVVKIQA